MSANNGGPAFPTTMHHAERGQEWKETVEGMTLRDYFAAKAMQSLIVEGVGYNSNRGQIKAMTETAYEWAKAMLRARGEP